MNQKNTQDIECCQLTLAERHLDVFTKLLELNRIVFYPNTPSEELPLHHQRKGWEEHLALPNARIFYAIKKSSTTSDQPIGFFFALPRTQPEIGYDLLHIRLAAVDPSARGLGVFPLLMKNVLEYARECGYKEITVCTFPARFTKMYRILNSHGWELVAWPMEKEKVLMKLQL